jgi:hypothetical protein
MRCPECGKPASQSANACASCGFPFLDVGESLSLGGDVFHSELSSQPGILPHRFLELQYQSLRREIEQSKQNLFRIVVGGAVGVPAAQYFASTYEIGAITLTLPFLVVMMVLLFLSENHAVMRTGTYILHHVESRVPGVEGWEQWLHRSPARNGTRSVDKLLVLAFSVLSAVYFVAAVVMAAMYAREAFGEQGQYLVSGVYVGLGVILGGIIYMQSKTDTEDEAKRRTASVMRV